MVYKISVAGENSNERTRIRAEIPGREHCVASLNMSSASTATTTAPLRQFSASRSETITVEEIVSPENQPEDEPEDAYLPANHGVTGRETDVNPPSWPRTHRRMPPYRQPVRHPEWDAIGGPLPIRVFMWDMFSGCQLLQVGLGARLPVTQGSLLMSHASGVTQLQGLRDCTIGDTVCIKSETSGEAELVL